MKRDQHLEEIYHRLFEQSAFSKRNAQEMDALAQLTGPAWHPVSELAALAKQIGGMYPGRRKRWWRLFRSHPVLFEAFKAHALQLRWWYESDSDPDPEDEWMPAPGVSFEERGVTASRGRQGAPDEAGFDEEIPF